jgi:hypothetical protein
MGSCNNNEPGYTITEVVGSGVSCTNDVLDDPCAGASKQCFILTGSGFVEDECGVCNGDNSDMDCNGDCFGGVELDECGICGGPNVCDYDNTSDRPDVYFAKENWVDWTLPENQDRITDNVWLTRGNGPDPIFNYAQHPDGFSFDNDPYVEWALGPIDDLLTGFGNFQDILNNNVDWEMNGCPGCIGLIEQQIPLTLHLIAEDLYLEFYFQSWGHYINGGAFSYTRTSIDCFVEGPEADECGICYGDDSYCSDCAGTPNGDNVEDMCGICDNDEYNDCTEDCFGLWGGDAELDECGVCNGNNIDQDGCGVCFGDNSSCADSTLIFNVSITVTGTISNAITITCSTFI